MLKTNYSKYLLLSNSSIVFINDMSAYILLDIGYVLHIVFSMITLIFGLVLIGVGLGDTGGDDDNKKRDIKQKLVNMTVRTLYLACGLFVTAFGISLVLTDVVGKEALEEFFDSLDKAVDNSKNE